MSDETTDDVQTLAALYALGVLEGEERAAFEAELRDCAGSAAAHLGRAEDVVGALGQAVPPQPPPPGLRARLLERVREEGRPPPASGRAHVAPGVLLVLAERLAWRDTGVPGIRCKRLFADPQRRYASSLVSMAPGATYPPHRHAETEELIMLSGDMRIGGYRLRCGDYCRAEAGTRHEPIHTQHGATFIAFGSLDDECLPEEPASGVLGTSATSPPAQAPDAEDA